MKRKITWLLFLAILVTLGYSGYESRDYLSEFYWLKKLDPKDKVNFPQAIDRLIELESGKAALKFLEFYVSKVEFPKTEEESTDPTAITFNGMTLNGKGSGAWLQSIVKIGPNAIHELLTQYPEKKPEVQTAIIQAVERMEPKPENAELLAKILGLKEYTPFWHFCSSSLSQLGREAAGASPRLRSLLNATDPKARFYSLFALRGIETDPLSFREKLLTLAEDKDPNVRAEAAFTIGHYQLSEPDARDKLLNLQNDPNSTVKNNADWALEQIGEGK